jgi:hypothetical protein
VRAVEDERADVARLEVVALHAVDLGGIDLFPRERDLHPVDVRRVEEAVGVVAQAEDGGTVDCLVAADAFEDAHAVVQRMGQDVGGRLAPRHHLAVVPDPPVAVGHRHDVTPCGQKR